MLKFYDHAVTFVEFPDEIALCVNITNCPCCCEGCSEPWLKEDIGEPLTEQAIDMLITAHPGCTTFGLMGGDRDHKEIARISDYIHKKYQMKVGFYSGADEVDQKLINFVDFYKVGRWIKPQGDESTWSSQVCGPINFPFSNQKYFEKHDGKLIDATYKFRQTPLGRLSRYVL